jgi:hypothetical protein
MTDLVFNIQPDVRPNHMRVVIESDGIDWPLPTLKLSADELEQLRIGTPTQEAEEHLIAAVSEWILSGPVPHILQSALGQGEVRLVLRAYQGLRAQQLANVPFELLRLEREPPLVIDRRMRALVHALTKKGNPATSSANKTWPLRVLIVRPNPTDIVPPATGAAAPTVPLATPIYEDICKLAERWRIDHFGGDGGDATRGQLDVRVLSSEGEGAAAVTWEATREELESLTPDILVFLGHGNLTEGFAGVPPRGELYFEDEQRMSRPVPDSVIKQELVLNPVPVVLLVGCLTAHVAELDKKLPAWMRGGQSVAEALVDSESGVHVAVGMRNCIESTDAREFLAAFFESLLDDRPGKHPGNLECAVRHARNELYQRRPHPASWSAPVIFSSLHPEPIFSFVQTAPPFGDKRDERDDLIRRSAWDKLSSQPLSGRTSALQVIYDHLRKAERDIRARAHDRGEALLEPGRVTDDPQAPTVIECRAGEQVAIGIELTRQIEASWLEGRVVLPPGLQAREPKPSRELEKINGRALFDSAHPGELVFRLEAQGNVRDGTQIQLPATLLFTFCVTVGPEAPSVHLVCVERVVTEPSRAVFGWINAVLVTPA